METSDDNPPKAYTGMIIGYTCLITALGQTLDKHEVTPEAYLVGNCSIARALPSSRFARRSASMGRPILIQQRICVFFVFRRQR
jgi:hypothetical protein